MFTYVPYPFFLNFWQGNWRRHLWTASKKTSLSFSSQSPLTFGELRFVYSHSLHIITLYPAVHLFLVCYRMGGRHPFSAFFPWLMTEFIVIVCQVTKSAKVTMYKSRGDLISWNRIWDLHWFCKESNKKLDLSWLISKVCAYWFSLISIAMSEKWLILFTIHNFVLNVTNGFGQVGSTYWKLPSLSNY